MFIKPLRFVKSSWKSLAPATLSARCFSSCDTVSLKRQKRTVTVTVTPSVSQVCHSPPAGAEGAAASRVLTRLLFTSASCGVAFCGHLQSSPSPRLYMFAALRRRRKRSQPPSRPGLLLLYYLPSSSCSAAAAAAQRRRRLL